MQQFLSAVEGLKNEVKTYKQGIALQYETMSHEIEVQKKLTRYSRRTWFEMMTYLFLVSILVSDAARSYATNGWWGLLFWTTQHGDGGPWEWAARAIGISWQALLLYWMGRRSQVPDWVFDRTTHAEEIRMRQRGQRR